MLAITIKEFGDPPVPYSWRLSVGLINANILTQRSVPASVAVPIDGEGLTEGKLSVNWPHDMKPFAQAQFEQALKRVLAQREFKQAMATAKAINRRIRKDRIFDGGKAFGVDYATWVHCYPQMAMEFNKAVQVINGGKPGRYLPKSLTL